MITISDKGSRGEREDLSVEEIKKLIPRLSGQISAYTIVPDEESIIIETLIAYADKEKLDLILTSGGTGLSPRDVTPEATQRVIEREVPGMAEAMRVESFKKTPLAMLSRGVVGTRGRSLIINLPGSPRGARENLAVVLPALNHGLSKLSGDTADCAVP